MKKKRIKKLHPSFLTKVFLPDDFLSCCFILPITKLTLSLNLLFKFFVFSSFIFGTLKRLAVITWAENGLLPKSWGPVSQTASGPKTRDRGGRGRARAESQAHAGTQEFTRS